MAISVLPVDGLINRLIQQNQRPLDKPSAAASDRAMPDDQVNISSQARAHAGADSAEQEPSRLESQLLQMYTARPGAGS